MRRRSILWLLAGVFPLCATIAAQPAAAATNAARVFIGGVAIEPLTSRAEKATAFHLPYDLQAIERHLLLRPAAPQLDPVTTAAITPGVFRSFSIPMKNFPVAGRWKPIYAAIAGCIGNACGGKSAAFNRIVGTARQERFVQKLDLVNRRINRLIAYKRDTVVYGKLDHWAKPAEILKRGAGDCEDFAILKMAALAEAGVPVKSMSLVVLQDREKNVFHAVLSVATGSGNFILDNVRDTVIKDTALPSYVPLYSFSTDRAWIHGTKAGGTQVADGGFQSVAPGEGPQEVAPKQVRRAGWMPRPAQK